MKSSISFVCQECGYDSPQWLGKCPECNSWNTLKEIRIQKQSSTSSPFRSKANEYLQSSPIALKDIKFQEKGRLKSGFSEMDGVLGGGIVGGSVALLAGDPGVGKSTLLLQVALNISSNKVVPSASSGQVLGETSLSKAKSKDPLKRGSVLYISGEESAEQVMLRASRIYKNYKKIKDLLVFSSTNIDIIQETIEEIKPSLVIVDSIQTMESESMGGLPGSVGQVRFAASQLIKMAKTLNVPIFIVGHVTKDGMVAGPMVLSHMVDCVLFLEGEKFTNTRILRCFKNRFGSVDEVGIFTMLGEGIKEANISEQLFLTKNLPQKIIGSIKSVTIEGSRAFPVEIQGLVVSSKIPVPRRVSSGFDYKRLELLLAVLQKHCNIPLGGMDVFLNIAGGIKLSDPAVDLSVCLAIFSSFKNISMSNSVAISEVGLLGELREASFFEKRIKEARKLGFTNILSHNKFKTLNEAIRSFGN